MHAAIRESACRLQQLSGTSKAPLYPNYAIYDTPLEMIYGANLPRLCSLQQCVDPDNVMGLAGGFKFCSE